MPLDEIGAEHVLAYERWLIHETLDGRPRSTALAVQTAWRRLRRTCPAWPQQELQTQSRVNRKALPTEAFTPGFVADLTAYMAALRNPDPLDPEQGRPMSEASIVGIRGTLLRAATVLAGTGVPLDQITALGVLVQPTAYRAILMAMHAEGKLQRPAQAATTGWTMEAYQTAGVLLRAAQRWAKLAPSVMDELKSMRSMVRVPRGGLSNRVQDRLAELSSDEDRDDLYQLPGRAFERADRLLGDKDFRRAAKLHETALALAIVLQHPLRAKNLAALDTARHFVHDQRGRLRSISIPASEVKNKVNIRFDLAPHLVGRIERHLLLFRPHIPGHASTTALFPGSNGQPRQRQSLGRHIRHLVEQQLGRRFHIHLARHLAVDILLEADERNLPLAQKVLGHRKAATTEELYGGRVTLAASRKLQRIVRDQADRVNGGRGRPSRSRAAQRGSR